MKKKKQLELEMLILSAFPALFEIVLKKVKLVLTKQNTGDILNFVAAEDKNFWKATKK